MKVVVSGYVGKKITGIGRNLRSLLANTSAENSYVVYANKDMAKAFELGRENVCVKTYNVSGQSSVGNLLWTTFAFPFKALMENADVALIPNFTLLLFKFKPTAVIIHDLIEFNVPEKFSPLRMFYRTKIADPLMARRSNRIMTISQSSADDLVSHLKVPPDKIDIVYCGVERERFQKVDEQRAKKVIEGRGWPTDFFLYAGTVDHPGKNSYSVIKAFEHICADGYEGYLVLAGMPGSGYEHIEAAIGESPYGRRIVLTGYVSDEELLALYSTCRAFCFVSLYEGFGMPPIEALSCGAQVIVSNTSSLPEAVGTCGIQVDPLNVGAISDAMRRALAGERPEPEKVAAHLTKFGYKELARQFERSLAAATGRA